jgi:hypothetical protein
MAVGLTDAEAAHPTGLVDESQAVIGRAGPVEPGRSTFFTLSHPA